MMLGGDAIRSCIQSHKWMVFREDKQIFDGSLTIGTNSVDVTLGNVFRIPISTGSVLHTLDGETGIRAIDPHEPDSVHYETYQGPSIVLRPGQVALGYTRERFDLGDFKWPGPDGFEYDIAPMYDGRSTCGRLFLASHITAGYGDVGFASNWTLELKNMDDRNALRLHAGMRIGQVSFHLVIAAGARYKGSYTTQTDGPKIPKLGKEFF